MSSLAIVDLLDLVLWHLLSPDVIQEIQERSKKMGFNVHNQHMRSTLTHPPFCLARGPLGSSRANAIDVSTLKVCDYILTLWNQTNVLKRYTITFRQAFTDFVSISTCTCIHTSSQTSRVYLSNFYVLFPCYLLFSFRICVAASEKTQAVRKGVD